MSSPPRPKTTPKARRADAGKTAGARGRLSPPHRWLFVLLGAVILIWLATWPWRVRLSRDAARLSRVAAQNASAQQAMQQMTTDEAATRRRVDAAPRDFAARLALADVLRRSGKSSEAADTLRSAALLNPRSSLPHTGLGQIFDAQGSPDLAILEYRRALLLDPNDPAALAALAYKYISLGWNRQAKLLLTAALQHNPDDPRLHVALALTLFQNNNSARDAEKHLLIARRLAPADPTILGPLVDFYRHRQRYPEALQIIEQAMPSTPNTLTLLVERAQIYLEMSNAPAAIAAANQVLQASPDDPQPLYIRALAQKQAGQTDAALRDLEQVHARTPEFEKTSLLLGQMYIRRGEKQKGQRLLDEYRRVHALDERMERTILRVADTPNDAQAHRSLGKYYQQQDNPARAVVEFKRVLELSPGDPDARALLVRALRQAGRSAEADAIQR